MISKAERLPVRNERRRPSYVSRTTCFIVKVFPPGAARSRFAVIVGKGVFKAATKRNRLRRVAAKILRGAYAASPPADVLVVALPAAGRTDEGGATAELDRAVHAIAHR